MTYKQLEYSQLGVSVNDVYKQMGYRGSLPDEQTQQETLAVISDVRSWLQPQFCFFVVRQLPDFSLGHIIERQLSGAEAYALFICTSGASYEAYQRQLTAQGDMVRVFIADALGSVIAERCADCMEQALQESVNKLGWHHTNRFSPGYCGWPVSEQQLLFAVFRKTSSDDEANTTCGVSLTDSSLMIPIKSVSGIIGLGRNVRKLDYTCGLCNYDKCYKRRRPKQNLDRN